MSPDLDRAFNSFTVGQNYMGANSFLLKSQHLITPVNQMAVALFFSYLVVIRK